MYDCRKRAELTPGYEIRSVEEVFLSQCMALIKFVLEFGTQFKNRAESMIGLTLVSSSVL